MRTRLVPLLAALALAAQGPPAHLDPAPMGEACFPLSSHIIRGWIGNPSGTNACARADSSEDEESTEADESGTVFLAADFTIAAEPLPTADTSIPIPKKPVASQDGPGVFSSRAPPFL